MFCQDLVKFSESCIKVFARKIELGSVAGGKYNVFTYTFLLEFSRNIRDSILRNKEFFSYFNWCGVMIKAKDNDRQAKLQSVARSMLHREILLCRKHTYSKKYVSAHPVYSFEDTQN